MYWVLFLILISTYVNKCHNILCNSTKPYDILDSERKASNRFELRPNIFIDSNNLLGKSGHEHKKEFVYGNGPNGVRYWPKLFPKCGGKHQSPINVDIASLKTITLPKLNWNHLYQELPERMTVSNTHNTLVLDVTFKNKQFPNINGGPLTQNYALKSIHFHWSSSDHKGSEHTVNKKTFPMEMHVVHYRSDLNFTNAVGTDKGLSVVAYIFEITNDKCNEAVSSLLSVVEQVVMEKDVEVDLNNLFPLNTLVDAIESDYVTYFGSLTTPPCHESVIWIVSPFTISIAKKQIERFRQISMGFGGFGDNYRPVQPLNDRVVNFVTSNKT